MDHFPKVCGKNQELLKPPPSDSFIFRSGILSNDQLVSETPPKFTVMKVVFQRIFQAKLLFLRDVTQLGDQKDCHYRALHPPWRRDFNESIQELSHLLVHLGRKEYSIYYPRGKTQIIPPTVVALLFISGKKWSVLCQNPQLSCMGSYHKDQLRLDA